MKVVSRHISSFLTYGSGLRIHSQTMQRKLNRKMETSTSEVVGELEKIRPLGPATHVGFEGLLREAAMAGRIESRKSPLAGRSNEIHKSKDFQYIFSILCTQSADN